MDIKDHLCTAMLLLGSVYSGLASAQGAPDACEVVNSAPKEIKLAVANYEPWMIIKSGKVSGIDLDIVNEIAARLGVEVKTVECNWADCLEKSRVGHVDLLTNMFRTPERERFLTFVEPAYLLGTHRGFYMLGDQKYLLENYADLSDKVVGFENGVPSFDKLDKDNSLDKRYFESAYKVLQALLEKDIKVAVGQDNVFDFIISSNEAFRTSITKQRFSVYTEELGYFGISKCSIKPKLWAAFETQLTKLINEGLINKFVKRYENN
ncbi:MAG: transporter substrate-binding domain-containing protein [Glaciecola sp.]|jgi:polar amino acid transport system substrate-binding protein